MKEVKNTSLWYGLLQPTPKMMYALLGVVVLCGLGLRTWNVNFDSSLNAHPDERSTTCFYAPSIGWPSSFEEFWDPQRSPLNPLWDRETARRRSFTYGHFPLYLGILTGELLSSLAPLGRLLPLSEKTVALMERADTACSGVAVAGRLLIGLLDTLTIFLLFLLGRRLYGAVGGLLAATLYAFTAQAVQLSHFFAMDPASTTFTVVAVYGGVVMVSGGWWRGVLYAGVGSGLAIASKFSAAPIVLVPLVAMLVVWQRKGGSGGVWGESGLMQLVGGVVLALVLAFVSFFMTSPYGVLDWENFLQATLLEQGEMVRGLADMPFTRQYRNTVPYVYFIEQQVLWGLGLPLGLVGLMGVMWGLGKLLLLRSRPGELLVWAWLVPYFGIMGGFLAKFNRYMSPVLPFVLLLVAGMLVAFSDDAGGRARYGLFRKRVSYLLALVGIVGGMLWSLAYVNGVYSREHTWVQSSRWVYANVESGSVILWELWDDPLPKGIPGEPGMDMGSHRLRHIDWSPYEEDTAEKYEILKGKLREADYVIYSSKRIYGSVDELPERYPMTTRYYELMFAEELGYVQVADIRSGPRLWGWEWDDQGADESWSLYDHPRVTVFAKERELSDAEFDALLGCSWEGAIPGYRGQDPPLNVFLNTVSAFIRPTPSRSQAIDAQMASAAFQPRESWIPGPSRCDAVHSGIVCYCLCGSIAAERPVLPNRVVSTNTGSIEAMTLQGRANKQGEDSGSSNDFPSTSQVNLLGWELLRGPRPQPGDTVAIRLYWQPNDPINENLHSFLQLYAPSVQRSWAVTQNHYPSCISTTRWNPDRYYVDDLQLTIPADVPPITYSLGVGLVSSAGERLAVPGSAADMLLLGPLAVAPAAVGLHQQEQPTISAQADTDDGLRLQGYDLLSAPRGRILRLFWETTTAVATNWTTYIHLHDPSGERIAQFDGPALAGLKPTSQWQTHALYIDRRHLILPTGLRPGEYLLRLGLYNPATGERLPFRVDEAVWSWHRPWQLLADNPARESNRIQFEDGQLLIPLMIRNQ